MVLTRNGNKRKLIKRIYKYFPPHRVRVELFFGAGGSFFKMPLAKYSILNDLDDDVFNLYMVILNNRHDLYRQIELMPISESLVKYWRKNLESEPVRKAIRFLLLSNFSYLGKGDLLRFGVDNAKKTILKNIEPVFEYLQNAKLMCTDFRNVISKISWTEGLNDKDNAFVYLDPVYLGTEYFYKVPDWTEKDTLDCLDIMVNCGIRCAMSEFDHPFVIDEAKKRGLQVIEIGERVNLKKRSMEILIVNYPVVIPEKVQQISMF